MSSTMTTSSMTLSVAQRSAGTYEGAREDAVQKMQSNLIRYTRANDRRMVLRSLKDVKFLHTLLLDEVQPSEDPLRDLENEIGEETVIVNDVPFKPVGITADGRTRSSPGLNNSLPMLKDLLKQLCDRKGVKVNPHDAYKKLVIRMAKTTASADPHFRMNALFGSSDLLVMPLTPEMQMPKSSSISTTTKDIPKENPVYLNIYESNGEIHADLSETFKFGLFRKGDVKPGRPWIVIDATVNERANFSNGRSARNLHVRFPDLY